MIKKYSEFIKESLTNSYKIIYCIYSKTDEGRVAIEKTYIRYENALNASKKIIRNYSTVPLERLFIYEHSKSPDIKNNLVNWWLDIDNLDKINLTIDKLDCNQYIFGLEAAYKDIILKSKDSFKILSKIKENYPETYEKLLKIDHRIETAAEMGELGF